MALFLVVLGIFAFMMLALALGVLFGRRGPQHGCGSDCLCEKEQKPRCCDQQ